MRVAYLNMSDSEYSTCPHDLSEANGICILDNNIHCSAATTYSAVVEYSKVCGRIVVFQSGSADGFASYNEAVRTINVTSLDGNYVDGFSLTRGSPPQHIWTFAAVNRIGHLDGAHCSCSSNSHPAFVGRDYFCYVLRNQWQESDCTSSSPPWFYKQLSPPTSDDIEMRACRDEDNENVGIQAIEIYVQ